MTITSVERLAIAEILLEDVAQKTKLDRICEYLLLRRLDSQGSAKPEKKGKGLSGAERLVVEVAVRKRQAELEDVDDEKFDSLCHELNAAVDALLNTPIQTQGGLK